MAVRVSWVSGSCGWRQVSRLREEDVEDLDLLTHGTLRPSGRSQIIPLADSHCHIKPNSSHTRHGMWSARAYLKQSKLGCAPPVQVTTRAGSRLSCSHSRAGFCRNFNGRDRADESMCSLCRRHRGEVRRYRPPRKLVVRAVLFPSSFASASALDLCQCVWDCCGSR